MLDKAATAHPNSWWWIKVDGADLVSGLGASVHGVWSGDVDLADGALEKARKLYDDRLQFPNHFGKENTDSSKIVCVSTEAESQFRDNVEFISNR